MLEIVWGYHSHWLGQVTMSLTILQYKVPVHTGGMLPPTCRGTREEASLEIKQVIG